jgi:hypothetical protein
VVNVALISLFNAGAIAPDAALLLSSLLYCGCLIAACLMEPSRLRSIVAFSAAATLLYTPLFKKLTGVKNATVATVIALAPLAGALAAGAVGACVGLLQLHDVFWRLPHDWSRVQLMWHSASQACEDEQQLACTASGKARTDDPCMQPCTEGVTCI